MRVGFTVTDKGAVRLGTPHTLALSRPRQDAGRGDVHAEANEAPDTEATAAPDLPLTAGSGLRAFPSARGPGRRGGRSPCPGTGFSVDVCVACGSQSAA